MANRHYIQDKEIEVTLTVKVKVTNVSNYNVMNDDDIETALESFEEEIKDELVGKLEGDYVEEIPFNCDYITYEVKRIKK